MAILINGDATTPQPEGSSYKEEYIQIQTDQTAIDGSQQRNYINQKRQVSCSWINLTPANYQKLIGWFNAGQTVTFLNNNSAYSGGSFGTFTALPTYAEQVYTKGNSILRSITAVIREV